MQAQPKFHKIKGKRKTKLNNENGMVYYILQYESKNFIGASCDGLDAEMFYPTTNEVTSEMQMLLRMCNDCPVKQACLEWALVHERDGIWGGMSAVQRARVRRRLKWGLTDPSYTVSSSGYNREIV